MINNESHPLCRIFISHSSQDSEFSTQLANDLREAPGENSVWYDGGLRAGDLWWPSIQNKVAQCDVFILIISPASMESKWVQREYGIALREDKLIIPLGYRETQNVWHDLKGIHNISFTNPERYTTAFADLLKNLPHSKPRNSYNVPEDLYLKKIIDTITSDFDAQNWQKLIDTVEEIKQLKPENITALIYFQQGKALLALDQKSAAIDALEKAHAMEGDEKQRLLILTELIPALTSLKQWAAVEKSTAIALKLSPDERDERTLLSHRRNALLTLLQTTSDHQQRLSLLNDLCTTLAPLGRWHEILQYTNEALLLAPNNPDFLLQRRDALFGLLNNSKRRLEFLVELCSILASFKQWDDILKYTEDALHWIPADHHFLNLRRNALVHLLPGTPDPEPRLILLRELCSVLVSLHQWDNMLLYNQEALLLAPDDHHFLTQRRDMLKRLLPDEHDQAQQLKLLRELCSVLATLGQWEEVLQRTTEMRQTHPKDYDIIKLQNHALIHQRILKLSATYDRFSAWKRACIAYWGNFFQGLLISLKQLIRLKWFIPATSILLILVLIGSMFVFLRPILTSSASPIASSPMVIKIGVIVPIDGKSKDNGIPIKDAANMAIDDINSQISIPDAHGHSSSYTLQLVTENEVPSGSNSSEQVQSQNDIQSLISDAQVAGVIGPYESDIAEDIMPEANRAPLALISPSNTNSCLTKTVSIEGCTQNNNLLSSVRPTGKVTYFRLATTDDYEGPAIANYLFNTLKLRGAYVIDDNELYGIGLANSFIYEWQKLKGTVIAHTPDSNPGGLVQAMNTNPPDVIFFAGRTDTGIEEFYKQIHSDPALQHTIYADGSGLVSPSDLQQTMGPITKPIYASFPFVDINNLSNSTTVNFITNFNLEEGSGNYGGYSAASYDSTNILIQAITTTIRQGVQPPRNTGDAREAKIFRQAVINAIQHISYNGVTGLISFDANGDTTNNALTINEFADGQTTWQCKQQIIINNPSTAQWVKEQWPQNGKLCPIVEMKE